MKASDYKDLFAALDTWIRQGQGVQAQRELVRLSKKKLPRREALAFAVLARRADLPLLGIRILNPIVRPTNKAPATASETESAEYALSLTKIGATQEGLQILSDLESTRIPEVLLYTAFAHFTGWDYESALPLLSAYVALPGIAPYQRLIGQVNLAAALVHEQHYLKARELLRLILQETHEKNYVLLQGNALELLAQNSILERDWEAAEEHLNEAQKRLSDTNSRDAFYVRKWRAILALLKSWPPFNSLEILHAIKAEARQRQSWETARDCDFFEAVHTKNHALATHLYFGTPFPCYRRRLVKSCGEPFNLPEEYLWNLVEGESSKSIFDLFNAEAFPGRHCLKPGHLLHRLLATLSSNFYRPLRIASLHALLYPEEFFNPFTAPTRVHQAIIRLRRWLSAYRIPLLIREQNGFYELIPRRPYGILIRNPEGSEKLSPLLVTLKHRYPNTLFSLQEARAVLKTSLATAHRLMVKAIAGGHVRRAGTGRSTRYIFF